MKIYTRKGDDGTTALMDGRRLSKKDLYITACGELDELNAFTGLVKSKIKNEDLKAVVHRVQSDLFTAGAMLADKNNITGVRLHASDIIAVEEAIDTMQADLPALQHFILPAGSETVALIHVCRAICRRAERSLAALHASQKLEQVLLQYMNRLSDYFFVLARYTAYHNHEEEEKWVPRV